MKPIEDRIFLEKSKNGLYFSPHSKRLIRSEYAALEWYRAQGWDGIVTQELRYGIFLEFAGFDFIYASEYRKSGLLEQKINELKTISTTELVNNYRQYHLRQSRDERYSYFHSETVFAAMCKMENREIFVRLARLLSEVDPKFVVSEALGGWPEILLTRDGNLQLVKVSPIFPGNKDVEKKYQERKQSVFDPLGISVRRIFVERSKTAVVGSEWLREETIYLEHASSRDITYKKANWKSPLTGGAVTIEDAALDWFKLNGWDGVYQESDAIRNCLRLLGLKESPRLDKRGENIIALEQARNKGLRSCYRNVKCPLIEENMFINIVEALGDERILTIASVFDQAGWPDLTLAKDGKLRFVEVKSENDRVQESQENIFYNVLRPLGLDFCILRVLHGTQISQEVG